MANTATIHHVLVGKLLNLSGSPLIKQELDKTFLIIFIFYNTQKSRQMLLRVPGNTTFLDMVSIK